MTTTGVITYECCSQSVRPSLSSWITVTAMTVYESWKAHWNYKMWLAITLQCTGGQIMSRCTQYLWNHDEGVSTLSKEFTGTCEHIWNLQEILWETNQLESAQLGSYLLLFADLPWLHPQLCSPFCSNPPVAVSLLLWQFSLHVPLQCFLITKRKEICLSHLSKDRKMCQLTSLLGRQVLFSIAQQWDSLWAAASPPPQTGVSEGLHPQVPSLLLP